LACWVCLHRKEILDLTSRMPEAEGSETAC